MRDPCVCMVQLEEVYGEVFRVLKPGGMFCSYEWVATKEFDPNDTEHVRIIDEINFGNGLPVRAPTECASVPRCLAVPASAQIGEVGEMQDKSWLVCSSLACRIQAWALVRCRR